MAANCRASALYGQATSDLRDREQNNAAADGQERGQLPSGDAGADVRGPVDVPSRHNSGPGSPPVSPRSLPDALVAAKNLIAVHIPPAKAAGPPPVQLKVSRFSGAVRKARSEGPVIPSLPFRGRGRPLPLARSSLAAGGPRQTSPTSPDRDRTTCPEQPRRVASRYRATHSDHRARTSSVRSSNASDGPDNLTRDPTTSIRPLMARPTALSASMEAIPINEQM